MAENRRTITLLKGYNNYFNRTIKYSSNIEDYKIPYVYRDFDDINFKPNDNVSTEIILNTSSDMAEADYLLVCDGEDIISRWFVMHSFRTREGQYKFDLRRDVIADNINAITDSPIYVERGYLQDDNPLILNDEGLSLNQIKRDEQLLKDKTGVGWIVGYLTTEQLLDGTVTASTPTATAIPQDNVIDFSSVASRLGLTVNQLLSIVNIGRDRDILANKLSGDITFKAWINYKDSTDYELRSMATINQGFTNVTNKYVENRRFFSDITLYRIGLYNGPWPFQTDNRGNSFARDVGLAFSWALEQYIDDLKSQFDFLMDEITLTTSQASILQDISNNYTYILYNSKYYKLKISTKGSTTKEKWHAYSNTVIKNIVDLANDRIGRSEYGGAYYTEYEGPIKTEYKATQLSLVLEEANVNSYSVTITDDRNRTSDATFSMFAIPYGQINVSYETSSDQTTVQDIKSQQGSGTNIPISLTFPKRPNGTVSNIDVSCTSNGTPSDNYSYTQTEDSDNYYFNGVMLGLNMIFKVTLTWTLQTDIRPVITQTELSQEESISLAVEIAKKLKASESVTYIYDLQLLPYCPCLGFFDDSNAILTYANNPMNLTEHKDFDFITVGTDKKGVILYPKSSNISLSIDYPLGLSHSMKIDSQACMYRIVSPNGSGGFEFNVAKNGGHVDYFLVDATYKPYTPYIRVAPQFNANGLYGGNYHDTRGLICGGDFSLPLMIDAWTSYQLQNKNYANIFDREIQNLDFRQSREETMQRLTMPFKVLGVSIGGAVGGAKMGIGGAIAGGVIGGVGGAVGGAVDIAMATELRNENKRYAIDKYNYQLGNIKALPTSMARNTSYTINNKVFPYLEYYTCTDEEIELLESKILYDSMIVMKIGNLTEYMSPSTPHYFKGRLIRGNNIVGDNHLLQEINDELEKGVYI